MMKWASRVVARVCTTPSSQPAVDEERERHLFFILSMDYNTLYYANYH